MRVFVPGQHPTTQLIKLAQADMPPGTHAHTWTCIPMQLCVHAHARARTHTHTHTHTTTTTTNAISLPLPACLPALVVEYMHGGVGGLGHKQV